MVPSVAYISVADFHKIMTAGDVMKVMRYVCDCKDKGIL
jgi:hypothetical protein